VTRREIKQAYLAQVASDETRQQLWGKVVDTYQGFETYQKRANPRQIPLIILSPIEE
jgi:hypothetical protein